MLKSKEGYLALSFHTNLSISRHLALITLAYIVNSSILYVEQKIARGWNRHLKLSAVYSQ